MEPSRGYSNFNPQNEFTHSEGKEQFRIARKPIRSNPRGESDPKQQDRGPDYAYPIGRDVSQRMRNLDIGDAVPELPARPGTVNTNIQAASITGTELQLSPKQMSTGSSRSTTLDSISTSTYTVESATSSRPTLNSTKSSAASFALTALQEARHFAGGLIAHPFESTKDYTILRHSHGLVFFKGASTNLAISIFAREPLPADRSIWLQNKGWTGKMGMRAKSFFGANDDWLNVTPAMKVGVEQLKPTNERAWQRDINRFRKKAAGHKYEKHKLRETDVISIPSSCGDGYFQFVLCTGEKKKVLCRSPVFRVISASSDPSSIRGASLSTLPLELGAMAVATYTQSTVGTVVSPVTTAVQNQVQRYMPSWWTQQVVTTAYDVSGASDRVNSTLDEFQQRYDQALDGSFLQAGDVEIKLEQGPMPPYPLRFVVRGELTRNEADPSSLPTIQPTKVPQDVNTKLRGYYFGWARVAKRDKTAADTNADSWYQAIISVLTLDASQIVYASVTAASKKYLTLQLIQDFEDLPIGLTDFEIQVMGFIRPDEPTQRGMLAKGLQAGDQAAVDAAMLSESNDVSMAQSVLDHPAWSPEALSQNRSLESKPGLMERVGSGYAETRLKLQKRLDRVPLQKLGLRLPIDEMQNQGLVPNGYYVIR